MANCVPLRFVVDGNATVPVKVGDANGAYEPRAAIVAYVDAAVAVVKYELSDEIVA